MTNKIFFGLTFFALFNIATYCMEEDSFQKPKNFNIDETSTNDTENHSIKSEAMEIAKRGNFAVLPDELIDYILELLVQDALAKSAYPLQRLLNILSNKDLANNKRINTLWNAIVTKKITKLVNQLVKHNKSKFIGNLFETSKKLNPTKEDIQRLKCFLKAGINITDRNLEKYQGSSALDTALLFENKKILELFLEHIAHMDQHTQLSIINSVNSKGNTLLTECLFHQEALELFLKQIDKINHNHQLDIFNARNEDSSTVLIKATFGILISYKTIESILKHISNLDPQIQLVILNAKDKFGNTMLMYAIKALDEDKIQIILNHISKIEDPVLQENIINAKNNNGGTAFDIALENRYIFNLLTEFDRLHLKIEKRIQARINELNNKHDK